MFLDYEYDRNYGHQPHIDMNTMKINNADRNSNILQEAPWQVKIRG